MGYDKISDLIDDIYTELTADPTFPTGGNAHLALEEGEEPWLGGVTYTAVPPGKRVHDMEHLSGGEKTVAALALLFAIHRVHPAPFFVLDEIDAPLDATNVTKVCNYIRKHSTECQFIVISLKEQFFQHGNVLFGICKDREQNSSKCLSWSLDQYDEDEDVGRATPSQNLTSERLLMSQPA
eukprot:NODE_954_length_729_cov_1179.902941_g650_i0.p1 GENE.NODE_954_length_729_cov_1179.902941_g650_i0~~NODE_954_length_729_cov_1179.902941_g650_i0.p1  ORF type:complete len:181 (-),score=29.04 NODE_954_length_729_cov_1179.902941_g650_i0:154-696(-)